MPRTASGPVTVTAADVERFLDKTAEMMARAGPDAVLAVPLYKRLERELEKLRDDEAVLEAARQRLRRSPDRTAA